MTKINMNPSGVSLHFEKHKGNTGEINGLQRHNERTPGGRHGNSKIDDERTKDNIFLIRDTRKLDKRISDTIEKNRDKGLKGVRKDAVRLVEGTVQLSGKILDEPEEKQVEVLKDSFKYLQNQFGEENFVSGVIHLDETHPHLHFDFVPIENKKLTAKTIISPLRLKKYQDSFLKHLQNTEPILNFKRGNGEFNGLSQADFERLTAQSAEIQKQIDKREEDLDKREDGLDEIEEKLNKRKTNIDEIEKRLNRRENNIDKIEKRLNRRENSLAEIEEKNKETEQKLNSKEKIIEAKKTAIKTRENKYCEAVETFNMAVSKLDKQKRKHDEQLKLGKTSLDEREKSLDEREKSLDEREKSLDEREKPLDERKKKLDEQESKTLLKDAEANEKLKKATEKLNEASKLQEFARKMIEQAEKAKQEVKLITERLNTSWQRVLDMVRHGDLEPRKVEETVKPYNPITTDKMEPLKLDLDELSNSVPKKNDIQL